MSISEHIAKHLREVYFGGNWTVSSVKEHLEDVTWQQSIEKIDSFNTIAALVFHMNFYVQIASRVMDGEPINTSDKYSFDLPPINSSTDWENMVNQMWADVEKLASQIERLPDNKLSEIFFHEKYKTYYRNLHGIIEHTHYHLGQIVLVKKMLASRK